MIIREEHPRYKSDEYQAAWLGMKGLDRTVSLLRSALFQRHIPEYADADIDDIISSLHGHAAFLEVAAKRWIALCDSDGNPQGGDACGSVHDSAAIAQNPPSNTPGDAEKGESRG